ncbi:MAG: Hpt domain-containing protein [Gemmatimonadetes bacterium]|nr:Hpt domain-containing protein [Gemmatimonadota bacterium]
MPETTLDVLALQLMQLDPADDAGVSEFVAGVRAHVAARGEAGGTPALVALAGTVDLLERVPVAQRGILLGEAGRYIERAMGEASGTVPVAEAAFDEGALPPDTDVDLLRDFIAESRDILTGAEAALLELESNPADDESVNTVFRAFHTIKGTAAFLGLGGLSAFAHHAESLLSLVRDKEIPYNSRCADLSLRSSDMLKAFLDSVEAAIDGSRLVPPVGADVLTSELERAAAGEIFEESVVETTVIEVDVITVAAAGSAGDAAGAAAMAEAMASVVAATAVREAATGPTSGKAKHEAELSVRVRTDRLDRLIDMVGELVIAQSMIAGDTGVSQIKNQALARKITHAGKIVRDLQDLSMSMRMVPLKGTFQKLTRLVRDLAQKNGKAVEFVTNGDDTEIDRNMVDAIADPLVHMVRNSLDHGLEPRDERQASGKRPQGTLKLSAFHQGGHVVVELKDDGRGLNREKIVAKAIARGLIESEKGMSDGDVWQLIFAPGFSTADKITDVS